MAGPSDIEQLSLEYINEARLDPLANAARYIKAYGATATSSDPSINSALAYFHVSGPALLAAYQALTPVQPVAWNETLAASARAHDAQMIATDSQSHQVPGELDLGARTTAAGYTGWRQVGENVYAYGQSALFTQAGFMVDWGNDADGMQTGAGHRVNIMSAAYREVGIGIVAENVAATEVGPSVVTEDFATRGGSDAMILGVAYTDADRNDFYSLGEGLGTLTAAIGGQSVASYATGGYTLDTNLTGAQAITFTGAGLSAPVTATVTLRAGGNIKLDIVNGTELKSSVSAVVSGPITTLEVIGVAGATLTATGSASHTLLGAGGPDGLIGGTGSDTISGGAGADLLTGGGGSDTFSGTRASLGGDTITDLGLGDHVRVTDAATSSFSYIRSGASLSLGDGQTVTLSGGLTGRLVLDPGTTADLRVASHYSGIADFNGDGHSDILWRNTNGALSTWQVSGNADGNVLQQNTFFATIDPSWTIVETLDFTGDGRADILWRNANGAVSVWNAIDGGFAAGSYNAAADTRWKIAGVGDLDGDGKDDLIWRNDDGSVATWHSSGTAFDQASYYHGSVGTDWRIAGTGDFDGDGKADILWRNTSGALSIWQSNGAGFNENRYYDASVDNSWHVDGIADFNGDGKDDLLWRNTNGAISIWQSDGAGFAKNTYFDGSVPNSWQIAQIGDFNDDGKADILWRNDNGALSTWESNGNAFDASIANATVPTAWTIEAHDFAYG